MHRLRNSARIPGEKQYSLPCRSETDVDEADITMGSIGFGDVVGG